MSTAGGLLCEYRDASKIPGLRIYLRTGSREENVRLWSGVVPTVGRLKVQLEAEAQVREGLMVSTALFPLGIADKMGEQVNKLETLA